MSLHPSIAAASSRPIGQLQPTDLPAARHGRATAAPTTGVAAAPATTPLLDQLLPLLRAARPACRQPRPFLRLLVLSLAQLVTLGRHTITGLLATLGLHAGDWSGFYRLVRVPRVDPAMLSQTLLAETLTHVPPSAPYVVALDGTHLPRASRSMPGAGWANAPGTAPFRRGIAPAQRVVGCSWLVPPTAAGLSRAIPLGVFDAFPPKATRPDEVAPRTEWQAGLAALRQVRAGLDAAGRHAQALLAVGDANYATTALWQALGSDPLLRGRTVLIARTRRNRALYELPDPPAPGQRRRGAPRVYGARAPTPEAWLHERHGWQQTTITVRGRTIPLTARVEGPYRLTGAASQPVFLIVVKGVGANSRHKHRHPTFLLVSAHGAPPGGAEAGVGVAGSAAWVLPLPVAELLAWAWQRWEVEVGHREWKDTFGVGEVQSWAWPAPLVAVQWQVWLYASVLLAGYRAWGIGPLPADAPVQVARWRGTVRRWSLDQLLATLRLELAQTGILPEYRVGWTWTTGMWGEMLDWLEADDPLGLRLAAD
jgi:hypothetical protein